MIYVSLPDEKTRRLVFYLAMEEYIAHKVDEKDCFFMWQVRPSVLFGRNQLIANEVNLDYCREKGIEIYRRKSGGGCIYADMNNVMSSYITKEDKVSISFSRFLNMVVDVLHRLNIPAEASGRNDILIEGKKVSGNAFYHAAGKSILHGTMLFDTDMENMTNSLTPNTEKLSSKGVQSIRQHIALLKDYTDIGIKEFKEFVKKHLCDEELTLTENDIREIEKIEKEYLSDEFIYGNNPSYNLVKRQRIEDVGIIEVHLELKNNIIKKINLLGDYFLVGDLDNDLLKRLQGAELREDTLQNVVPADLNDVIMNLKKEDFIRLLLQ